MPTLEDTFARFFSLEQFLRPLPGATLLSAEAEASVLGISPAAMLAARSRIAAEVSARATELRNDPELTTSLERLPLAPGDSIVCFGDSITSDRGSWAEILAEILRHVAPEVTVYNEGRIFDTTTDLIIRFGAAVALRRPRWVVILTGRNDVCRYNPQPAPPLVSKEESIRNVVRLDEMVQSLHARALWINQPPVVEDMLTASPLVDVASWHDEDVQQLSVAMAEAVAAVDLQPLFRKDNIASLYQNDGVHPNADGHALIARAVLQALAMQDEEK